MVTPSSRRSLMKRLTALAALALALGAGGCATTTGNAGKTCLHYAEREVPQSYCARQAEQSCRTYCDSYGCRTNCGGGGYCASYATRMVKVRECVSFVCEAGYERFEGGCFTPAQIEARKTRRADNVLALAARRYRIPRNSPDAVDMAGFILNMGLEGVDADPQRAFDFYARECEEGNGGGCRGLASMYRSPVKGVPQAPDPDKAEALMRQGCDAGYGVACSDLADQIRPKASADQEAVDPSADFGPALALYERACDDGYPRGCNRAAALYELERAAAAKPGARAYVLYLQGCEGGKKRWAWDRARGCLEAAGYIYNGIDDLPPDPAKARALVRRAQGLSESATRGDPMADCIVEGRGSCGLDVESARVGSAGLIADFEGASAEQLFAAAIKLNGGDGVRKDNILARRYAERACELGDARSCRLAGDLAWFSEDDLPGQEYSVERREGLQANRQAAIALFDRSCELGFGDGCRRLGHLRFSQNPLGHVVSWFGNPQAPAPDADLDGAFSAFEEGCDAGEPIACEDAAQMLLQGHVSDPQRAKRALALFSKGCGEAQERSGDSCVYAARLLFNGGDGIAKDRTRAAELMAAARAVDGDGDRYDGSNVLHAAKVGHCILLARNDAC